MILTLLQYVQNITSALGSDQVNSIGDSVESQQIAEILKTVYFNIIDRTHLPEHKQLLALENSLDATQPVVMIIPDGVSKLEWIKYFNSNVLNFPSGTSTHGVNTNITPTPSWSTTSTTTNTIGTGPKTFTVASGLPIVSGQGVSITSNPGLATMNGFVVTYSVTTLTVQVTSTAGTGTFNNWNLIANPAFNTAVPGYQDVTMIPVHEFLNIVTNFNPTNTNVKSFVFTNAVNKYPGTFTFYYKNDRQPMYCTVISDNYVIFDSYDNTQDSTLQGSKSMFYGQIIPAWKTIDTFIPNLDETEVPLLLNEAKSLAFFELKQMAHPKAEQEAKRQWSSIQKDKSKSDQPSYFDQLPNFGRYGRSSHATPSPFKSRGWDRP